VQNEFVNDEEAAGIEFRTFVQKGDLALQVGRDWNLRQQNSGTRMTTVARASRNCKRHTQCVQVLLGLCPLNIQDMNYFQNFTLLIQNSLPLSQYIAGIDLNVYENSHCTPFVESHVKLRTSPLVREGALHQQTSNCVTVIKICVSCQETVCRNITLTST
jgi:hypothetical protein